MESQRLVVRLGLVRFATSLLFIVLATVLNRILVVELMVPVALVTFSFAFQHVMTPVGLITGYLSDAYGLRGRHRSPYIWGGMAMSLAVMPLFPFWALAWGKAPHDSWLLWQGVALFSLFGTGATVSATAVNALLVDRIPREERGAAMTLLWILTLMGFIAGSGLVSLLYPAFDPDTLPRLFGGLTALAALLTVLGTWGLEPPEPKLPSRPGGGLGFWPALRFLSTNRHAGLFFLFLTGTIFFSALQTFILTPFGGEVLGLPVAVTSQFGIYLTYGILAAMVGLQVWWGEKARRKWKILLSSALLLGAGAFVLLSLAALAAAPRLGLAALALLGVFRGFYNVGLSHLTMSLSHPLFSGIFMGLWNLVSGLALAAGEMSGGFLKDVLAARFHSLGGAYAGLFFLEAAGLVACLLLLWPLKEEEYQENLARFLCEKLDTSKLPLSLGIGTEPGDGK